MNPSQATGASDLGTLLGWISGTGIEAYQLSQGAPISVTSATPGTLIQTGSAITQTSIGGLALIAGVFLVLYLLLKR